MTIDPRIATAFETDELKAIALMALHREFLGVRAQGGLGAG